MLLMISGTRRVMPYPQDSKCFHSNTISTINIQVDMPDQTTYRIKTSATEL